MAVQEKRRKVGAVLAGGLVLGVGAAVVMAAWNSSEFATGSFGTGGFVLEGKLPADADFTRHESAEKAAKLDFAIDTSNLSPGEDLTAAFAVRLAEKTTHDGTAVINTEVANAVTGLTQRVYVSATPTCDGTVESEIIASTPLATGAGSDSFALAKGVAGAVGETVNLCFEVSAGNDLVPNSTSVAVWNIAATQE